MILYGLYVVTSSAGNQLLGVYTEEPTAEEIACRKAGLLLSWQVEDDGWPTIIKSTEVDTSKLTFDAIIDLFKSL